MEVAWIVVAQGNLARIFMSERGLQSLREIETLVHPESRLHNRDLKSDSHGRSFDSGGQGRHRMGSGETPKQHEVQAFAHELSQRLEKARVQGDFSKLVIAAPPAFLGQLRKSLSPALRKSVVNEIDKNLTSLDPAALGEYLSAHLTPD